MFRQEIFHSSITFIFVHRFETSPLGGGRGGGVWVGEVVQTTRRGKEVKRLEPVFFGERRVYWGSNKTRET